MEQKAAKTLERVRKERVNASHTVYTPKELMRELDAVVVRANACKFLDRDWTRGDLVAAFCRGGLDRIAVALAEREAAVQAGAAARGLGL